MAQIAMFILACVTGMVVWTVRKDLQTYPARQDAWEKEHPGATYVRGWKHMNDAERKAYS